VSQSPLRCCRLVTATALVIIDVSKFAEGDWITIVAIPCVILPQGDQTLLRWSQQSSARNSPLQLRSVKPPVVLGAIHEWNRLTDRAPGLALELSPDVLAVHLTALEGPDTGKDETRTMRDVGDRRGKGHCSLPVIPSRRDSSSSTLLTGGFMLLVETD
jgi:hypothetical protein